MTPLNLVLHRLSISYPEQSFLKIRTRQKISISRVTVKLYQCLFQHAASDHNCLGVLDHLNTPFHLKKKAQIIFNVKS